MGTLIVKPRLDIDAKNYIDAVQDADNAFLEPDVRQAINQFVKGCKSDGIWDAIKASCILAGARTLDGALIPLKGSAPTNHGIVAGNYSRKTGLLNDGSAYLNINTNTNSVPQSSVSLFCFVTEVTGVTSFAIGTAGLFIGSASRLRDIGGTAMFVPSFGFLGASRGSSDSYQTRYSGSTFTVTAAFFSYDDYSPYVFSRNINPSQNGTFRGRLSIYGFGEHINLALLDARIATFMSTLNSVIP